MTTTISDGVTTLHPTLWMDYASNRDTGTKTHRLMSGKTTVTLAPAGPRRVTIALLFDTEQASLDCEEMHATAGVVTITEDGRSTHSMQYVVVGRIERTLDDETQDVWIVTAEVQEVGS